MKIKGVKTPKYLSVEALRNVCIGNNYYTRGDVRAYDELFQKLYSMDSDYKYKELTEELLIDVATDIFDHSNIEVKMKEYGCNEEEVMNSIIHNLVNACYSLVEVEYE